MVLLFPIANCKIQFVTHRSFIHCRQLLFFCCKPFKLVIDSDVGSDDGVALSLILGSEALYGTHEVIGITAVHGNTNVDQVARNILKLLKTTSRLDIPVYKGANFSILETPPGDNFYGNDGFGDFEFPDMPSEDLIKKMHAVNYLTSIAQGQPGSINLLCIGPLTNIAMAIRMDEKFLENIGNITILGGSVFGLGNVKPGVEFNMYIDPEAAAIVMETASKLNKTINVMPWESAVSLNISMDWRKNVLGEVNSTVVRLLNKAEMLSKTQDSKWISSDTFAAVHVVDMMLPHQKQLKYGKTETCGKISRGATFVDYRKNPVKNNPQLNIVTPGSLSKTHVQDFILQVFTNYEPGSKSNQ